MVLHGAEVVHLVAGAEVQGQQPALARPGRSGRSRCAAGRSHRRWPRRPRRSEASRADPAALQTRSARRRDRAAGGAGRTGGPRPRRRARSPEPPERRQVRPPPRAPTRRASSSTSTRIRGKTAVPSAVDPVHHHDGIRARAPSHPDAHRSRGEGPVERREGIRLARRPRRARQVGPLEPTAARTVTGPPADVAADQMAVVGFDRGMTRPEAAEPAPDGRQGAGPGAPTGARARSVAVEVERIDAAVAPLFEGGGRKALLTGIARRRASLGPQPGRAAQRRWQRQR